MSDASTAVQKAIIAKLRGDITLQGLLAPATGSEWNIFDQGGGGINAPSFPYVYVHPITMQVGTLLALGTDANDIYIQVNTYTKFEGFEQARGIAARVYALLHGPVAGQLTLSGGPVNPYTMFDNRQELEEVQDSLVQHIADRYKIFTQG